MQCWIIFLFILHEINGLNICDNNVCGCKTVNGSLYADCSLQPDVLQSNVTLANTTISLNLSRNNLTSLQNSPLQSDKLEEIFLNDNSLKEIRPTDLQLPQLKRLDLENNQLETIDPKVFETLNKLECLNLINNKFTTASQLTFAPLVDLKELYLDDNNIGPDLQERGLFDANGYGLSLQIQTISMNRINLTDLADDYFKPVLFSVSFKKLSVSNNSLTRIFEPPHYSRYLDFSDNPIRNLSRSLWELLYVDTLKLNNLDIREVPKGVFALIVNLELEGNSKLTNFSHVAFGRQILTDTYDFFMKNLTLKNSNFSTLDERLRVLFAKLERLDLQGNPWNCDCKLAWLLDLKIAPDLAEDLRCASPKHLKNRRIEHLRVEDFACPKTERSRGHDLGVTIGILLYSMLIIFTVIWIYVFLYKPARAVQKQDYTQLN